MKIDNSYFGGFVVSKNVIDKHQPIRYSFREKSFRPNPSEYLSKEYIDTHLSKFENGASFVVTKDAYEDFIEGRGFIGFPDNSQFVAASDTINDIIHTSNGNLEYIEKSLGFDAGYFDSHGGLVQIDVKNLEDLNLRLPSGNEMGANTHWLPGGYTDGGTIEAIIDQIPNNNDFVNIKFFK